MGCATGDNGVSGGWLVSPSELCDGFSSASEAGGGDVAGVFFSSDSDPIDVVPSVLGRDSLDSWSVNIFFSWMIVS